MKNPVKTRKQVWKNQNAHMVHRYLRFEREGHGRSELTIRKLEYALSVWSDKMPNHDFKSKLTQEKIIEFKDKLRASETISVGTRCGILRHNYAFFEWLSQQTGYRSKVKPMDLKYFLPNRNERSQRNCNGPVDFPLLSQILQICESIAGEGLLDQRDQAIIAFLFITGARVDAVASLPIGCIDIVRGIIDQNPRKGVRTKNSKHIRTVIFPFSAYLTKIVREWHKKLLLKGYGANDPFFPSAAPEKEGLAYVESVDLSHEALTASGIRRIIKRRCQEAGLPYFHPHALRHGCVYEARLRGKNVQDTQAISQNIGHESMNLIIDTYAQIPESILSQCIKNLEKEE